MSEEQVRQRARSRRGAQRARVPSWVRAQLPFLVVLAGVLLGLGWVALHHFKRGSALMATALVVGALLRFLLSERQAGALAVRTRPFDVTALAGLGMLLAAAAVVVPPP